MIFLKYVLHNIILVIKYKINNINFISTVTTKVNNVLHHAIMMILLILHVIILIVNVMS